MPPDVGGERTEPATPKRREEVRKKGQLARTAELGPALMILTSYLVFTTYGRAMADGAIRMVRYGLTAAETQTLTPQPGGLGRRLCARWPRYWLLCGRCLCGLVAQLAQVGFCGAPRS